MRSYAQNHSYSKDKMIVVLALEEERIKKSAERARKLEENTKRQFFFYKTIIPS